MIESMGYLGAILLSLCAFPQALMSIKNGNSHGLSYGFLMSWYIGEILMLAFTVDVIGFEGPLFFNYCLNAIFLTIIVYYRFFPRAA